MAVSEAKKRANAKYSAKAYELISVRVKKGQKEVIAAHAAKQSESINSFINRAVEETMQRDNDKK